MGKPQGHQSGRKPLTLRDELALDRTRLANERTLMAYLRTAIALLLAGATMIHFANRGWFLAVGVACLPAGLVCGGVGLARYLRIEQSLRPLVRGRRNPPTRDPREE